MATNIQIKNQVDLDITNKISSNSITPVNVGTNVKSVVDYIDQEISNISLTPGPQGPQGLTGPQGLAGANGLDGATGPMGPQGLNGTVSYTEGSINTSSSSLAQNPSHTGSKITQNFIRAYVTSPTNNYLGLSNIGKIVGESFIVRNQNNSLSVNVLLIDNARLLGTNGFESTQNFEIKPNTYARFTLISTTGGSDKVFMVEVINPLGTTSGIVTKTLKTVISSSEVLNLFSTPIIILQNDNPLTIKLPVSIYVKKGAGTEYTMVGQLLEIKDSNSNQVNNLSSQFLTTTDGFAQCSFIFNNNSISSNKMGNYTINLQSSNPTIGTAPLEVYVVYNEITL